MKHNEESAHIVGYGTYILVWLGLLMLTGLTVAMAGFHLGAVSVFAVILVAATKSTLVLNYFMHLKYESPVFRIMVFVVLFIIAIFIGLLFVDVAFR